MTKSSISHPPEEPYVIIKSSVVGSGLGSEKKNHDCICSIVHLRAGEKTLDKL